MKMYIVMGIATPLAVCWDPKQALDLVSKLKEASPDGGVLTIHEADATDLRTWIVGAMQEAAARTPEKPVVVPDYNEAFDWMVSEVGEAAAARIHKIKEWKRNHPEKHLDDSFDHEVGQAILMGILASASDPLDVIKRQLSKWGYDSVQEQFHEEDGYYGNLYRTMTGTDA